MCVDIHELSLEMGVCCSDTMMQLLDWSVKGGNSGCSLRFMRYVSKGRSEIMGFVGRAMRWILRTVAAFLGVVIGHCRVVVEKCRARTEVGVVDGFRNDMWLLVTELHILL